MGLCTEVATASVDIYNLGASHHDRAPFWDQHGVMSGTGKRAACKRDPPLH